MFLKIIYKSFSSYTFTHYVATKKLSIGNKETDAYTRDEYNKLTEEAGMIDINTK